MTFHLAQMNVGRLRAPMDSPDMAEFAASLDEINALADMAPGFVWRFQTTYGDATAERPYDDEQVIINFSVWQSAEQLHDYVYRTAHAAVMARRKEWFERMSEAILVLWWIPAGELPTTADAMARLEHLRQHGPTPHAFTFRQQFPAGSPLTGQ
jgi:hypothetical protein